MFRALSQGAFQFRERHEHDVGAKHSDSAFALCKVPLPNASPLLSPKVKCTPEPNRY